MRKLALFLMVGLIAWESLAAEPLWVGRFHEEASDPLAPWRVVRLDPDIPPTHYRLRMWDGVDAVEAQASASMALLARTIEVDLTLTPILCWQWRIDAPLITADMATKAGDDYAARVYVAFSLPLEQMSWATRTKLRLARALYGDAVPDAALNYVWDNRYPVGTRRANAYTDRTEMIVLRTGAQHADRWVSERRDVLADALRAFTTDRVQVSLLAVATDTDNTGEQARAGFADIHFVARDQACMATKAQ